MAKSWALAGKSVETMGRMAGIARDAKVAGMVTGC
jgi:hypothetical protein